MRRIFIAAVSLLLSLLPLRAVTLEECVSKAEANYPQIKKYGLMDATLDIDLSDINKGWLPRMGLYLQGTVQNDVPSFPESLTGLMAQFGKNIEGLGKFQYKVGLDLQQTIYDGGVSKARREVARANDAVRRASLEMELYPVRSRVQSLYFAVLLSEEQIAQSRISLGVIEANLAKMRAMVGNGAATSADADMFEAQALTLVQSITRAESALAGYRMVLGLFTAEDMTSLPLEIPSAFLPDAETPEARPEMHYFNRALDLNEASRRLNDTSLLPKVGLFAQAYYGYPGLNYFESMLNRNLSFNVLGGIKVSWNIDALYTRGNNRQRSKLKGEEIAVERETFLFNNAMETRSLRESVEGLQKMMKDDERIVELRASVRRAAESRLENGVIDATDLLTKIADENLASLSAKLHKIQLAQEIYKLKYNLNR